jgi:hypothetical protein
MTLRYTYPDAAPEGDADGMAGRLVNLAQALEGDDL